MRINGRTRFFSVLESTKCPKCCKEKEKGCAFCTDCLEKLPSDIVQDLKEPHDFTQVAAFADATIFLMTDWR